MFLEAQFQRQDIYQTWESKVIENTVLKMPLSISPFLQPLQCSPHQEDTLEDNVPDDLSRLTSNHSYPFSSAKEAHTASPPFSLSRGTFQILKKEKKCSFNSKVKTLLRIISLVKQVGMKRRYLVEFRYGNEAKTHIMKMSEAKILSQDPELLIELLIAAKKVQRR